MLQDEQPADPGGGEDGVFIKAAINPARVDDALRVLMRLGVTGAGVQRIVGVDLRSERETRMREWSLLEFRVPAEMKEEVLLALKSVSRTGRCNNDGRIFILQPASQSSGEKSGQDAHE